MKPSKRIFHILLSILLLHGSTIGYYEKIQQSERTQHEETFLAVATSPLSSFTTKHENYRPQFHGLDHYPVSDAMMFSTFCRVAGSLLCNKLLITLQLSSEHIPRLRNTTIVFPFHTFP